MRGRTRWRVSILVAILLLPFLLAVWWRTQGGRVKVRVDALGYEPTEVEAVARDDGETVVEVPLRRR